MYDIPLQEPEVLGKVVSPLGEAEVLGVPGLEYDCENSVLKDVSPASMDDLIRIHSLSHSMGAWTDNALNLIKAGAPLKAYICSWEDIFRSLTTNGVDREMAFEITRFIRLGKGKRLKPEMEEAIRAAGMPAWYIDSCKEVVYLWSRADSVPSVMTLLRLAYFKIYYPEVFYTAWPEHYAAKPDICSDCRLASTKTIAELRETIDDLNRKIEETIKKFDNREIEFEEYEESVDALDTEIDMLKMPVEVKSLGIHIDPEGIFGADVSGNSAL